jgi:hypothetical protein
LKLRKLCIIVALIVAFAALCAPVFGVGATPTRKAVKSSATATGYTWTGNTITTGQLGVFNALALTSGDAIRIVLDNDALTTGNYINCLGGSSANTTVFEIGEDGATTITSAVATTNSLSITNLVSTAGDLITLTLDDDTADADTFYISCLGGTDHATSVFTLGEGGVMTLKGGATIDNATSATVLNLTETTVRATGDLDVTGKIDIGGGSGGSGATITTTGVAQFDGAVTCGSTLTVNGLTTLGPNKMASANIISCSDGSETLSAAQSGSLVVCSKSDGVTTITLPDPGASTVGCIYHIVQTANQDVEIVPTTADGNSIVSEGVATSDKVTLTHGSNKIGVGGYIIGISATKWWVGGFADTTLTVEAAD